jgi:hypothetical protein
MAQRDFTTSTQEALPLPASRLVKSPFVFEDVTELCNIHHTYENGESSNHYTILESLGGGAAVLDFDQDGKLDVLLASGGKISDKEVTGIPPRLFRQKEYFLFEDITSRVGLDRVSFYNHAFAISDYDLDGWPDVLVTGYGRTVLLRNRQGKELVDITTRAAMDLARQEVHWSTIAVWVDFDQDGFRDLYVGHYVDWNIVGQPKCAGYGPHQPRDICPPNRFAALMPQLFFNQGDGTFIERAVEAGLQPGKALGAVSHDWNADGWPDLYVANDAIANQLYLNTADGHFHEEGVLRGVAGNAFGEPDGSMGVACIDLKNNGLLSLAVTNYQGQWHAFYENRGDGWFDYAAARYGWAALGTNHVGWGVCFGDWDLDGDQDALIAQGHVIRHPPAPQTLAQAFLLLLNPSSEQRQNSWHQTDVQEAQGQHPPFIAVAAEGYFAQPHRSRSVAMADFDDDGQWDLVVTHVGEPVRILRNTTRQVRSSQEFKTHWWGINLAPWTGRDLTGWKIRLTDAAGHTQVRTLTSGEGYLACHDPRVVFGLSTAPGIRSVDLLSVDGQQWSLAGDALQLDQYHRSSLPKLILQR